MATDGIKNSIISSDLYKQAIADGNIDASEMAMLSSELGIDASTISSALSGSIFTAAESSTSNSGLRDDDNEFIFEEFENAVDVDDLVNITEETFIQMAEKYKEDSGFWENIYNAGAESIYEQLNTDNINGLSEEELAQITMSDKDSDSISSDDLKNFFMENDVNITTKTINEAKKVYKNAHRSDYGDNNPNETQIDAARSIALGKTTEEKITETEGYIKEAETELTTAIQTNTNAINEAEGAINDLVQSLELTDEESIQLKTDYDSNEQQIIDNNTGISTTKQNISTNKSSTTAAEGELTSLKAELGALDSVTVSDDQETNIDTEKTRVQGLIESKEKEIEALKKELDEVLTPELDRLEEEKTTLEGEKNRILNSLMSSSEMESTANQAIQIKIEQQQTIIYNANTAITTAETNTETKLAGYKSDLLELKETEGVANGISAGSTAAGLELVEYAKEVAANMNSTGWCLSGVGAAVYELTGQWPQSTGNDADGSVAWFQSKTDMFTDITSQVTTQEDIDNLPPGAIVIYEETPSAVWGHIEVRLGPGQACSDNFKTYTLEQLGNPKFHVFMPTYSNNGN